MTSLIKQLAHDATEPFERLGVQLLRRGAPLVVAVSCLGVSLVFLTAALNNFLQELMGPQLATLSVGGIYLCAAAIAFICSATGRQKSSLPEQDSPRPFPIRPEVAQPPSPPQGVSAFSQQIEGIVAPMLGVLHDAGLERERAALLAGAAIAKELKPVACVAFAVITGFVVGRRLHKRQ
jgi:hypothetical protein